MLDCKSLKNCENCENSTSNPYCKKCSRGSFLFNGSCLELCPSGFRADRITWSCLEPPVFAWYWVFPTKNSCKNKCNNVNSDNKDFNCSCLSSCVQEGSCCPDYDFFCWESLFPRKGDQMDKKRDKKRDNRKMKQNLNK